MVSWIGYAAMGLLGVVLGLIGAGGSILAVPIFVYLFAVPATQATGYSLLVVGATAALGAAGYVRRGEADLRTAAIFSPPAILGVYLTRRFFVPAIPEVIGEVGGVVVTRDLALLLVFALFMIVAAISMIHVPRGGKAWGSHDEERRSIRLPLVLAEGLGVGLLTGLVGAGGGFMIIPALVILVGLPMRRAIGTSLVIIAAKSLLGFIGEAQGAASVDYAFLAAVTVTPLFGILLGMRLNRRLTPARLRVSFGWFVLLMGFYILFREMLSA
ncbi:MAG: sulfite exporter TauE/SafE family protein [Gemmatimonadota bacterium]